MSLTRRLLSLARDSRLALALTILTGFLAGILIICQAWLISMTVNGVFLGGKTLPDVLIPILVIFSIVILRALLAWGSEVSANVIAVRIKSGLRFRLFEKILSLGPIYTRRERTGELVNTAVSGVEALDAYFSQYVPQLVIAALVPLSILVVVFPHDPLSGIILLLTAPLIPVFMYLIGNTSEKLTHRQWDTLSRLSAHFFDSLQGLRTLKELGRSKDHARSIAEASDKFRDVTLGVLRVTFLSALVLELVATISTALVAVEVGLRLLYGQMTFQPALFLLILAPEFYIPLRMLGLRFHAGMSGTNAARRIFKILDEPSPEGSSLSPDTGKGDAGPNIFPHFSTLSLENLSFSYPGEKAPALQDVSLEISAGEHIALVGSSGAGKSTLVALLLRFLKPGEGQIRLDGLCSDEVSAVTWRRNFAWVPQTPFLFHDTLANNLRVAKNDASQEELESALNLAHLDAFVHELPDGYETIIGEGGARLSSGQAQRLALARAFLKNAPVLILDEPTSNLDPQQETYLESSLRELMRDHTIITIAHRLNTVFLADRIYVLEDGQIVETGKHQELLEKKGSYAALVKPSMDGDSLSHSGYQHYDPSSDGYPLFSGKIHHLSENEHYENKIGINNEYEVISSRFNPVIFLRLINFLKGSWGWVALAVLLGVLTVGSNVGLMGTASYLLSAAALHPQIGTLEVAIVGVRFFGLSRGIFRYAERLTSHNVTFRLLARLRTWFFQKLEPLAPARLMQYRAGDLLSRIVSDVETLEDFFVRVISPPLVALLVALGMALFLHSFAPGLAWIELAGMVSIGIILPIFTWFISHTTGSRLLGQRAELGAIFAEGIQGLPDMLAFDYEAEYARNFLEKGRIYGNTQRNLARLTGLSSAFVTLLVNFGMVGILVYSIPLVTTNRIPGVMLAVLTLTALAGFEAVIPLPTAAQSLSTTQQAAQRLFDLVDASPAVEDQHTEDNEVMKTVGSHTDVPTLAFSHLSFTYPGSHQPALQDVSFELPPGKRLAIVGPSGAGKSTLANLLFRFWDYSKGEIILDDIDLHRYPQEKPRNLISLVSQGTYFFNDTVRNNLLLANPTADEDQIHSAAKRAQIHDFIMSLPQKFDTYIGEHGLRLSGGERQRLGLARAFLRDAPIFLLDEPTANLDPITERLILESLFMQVRDRSLVLITHRLTGLENVDEILVLDHGRVRERGTQAELLLHDGLYRNLWDCQNRMLMNV